MAAEIGALVRCDPAASSRSFSATTCRRTPESRRRSATAGTQARPAPSRTRSVVNRAGRRFGDESFFPASSSRELRRFDVATHTYRNLPCYFVFSRGPSRSATRSAERPPARCRSSSRRGETPEALAAALGIDPRGLRDEIARFNGFVANGSDADVGRGEAMWSRYYSGDLTSPTPNLGALEPPFYGVQLHPTGMSSAGLLTTARGQVVSHRDRPIPETSTRRATARHTSISESATRPAYRWAAT